MLNLIFGPNKTNGTVIFVSFGGIAILAALIFGYLYTTSQDEIRQLVTEVRIARFGIKVLEDDLIDKKKNLEKGIEDHEKLTTEIEELEYKIQKAKEDQSSKFKRLGILDESDLEYIIISEDVRSLPTPVSDTRLLQLERKFPTDFRFTYLRASLKDRIGSHEHGHPESFAFLKIAAEKARNNGENQKLMYDLIENDPAISCLRRGHSDKINYVLCVLSRNCTVDSNEAQLYNISSL